MATSKKTTRKKKPAAKKHPTSKKKVAKKASKSSKSSKKPVKTAQINDADKQKMIEEAAYFIAQERNFAPGNLMEDWLVAEIQINKILKNK